MLGVLLAYVMEHSSVRASSLTRSDYLTWRTALMHAGRMTYAHGTLSISSTTTVYSTRIVLKNWTAVLAPVVRGTALLATTVSSHG